MSVKFNPIKSSLKHCLVNGVAILQTSVNENPRSVWVCTHDDGSILIGECSCVPENVIMFLQYCILLKTRLHLLITTPAQAKSKNGIENPPNKIGNVLLEKPHPKYDHDKIPRYLSIKRSRFDIRSPLDSDISFRQID